jgi:hypothetical protein
MLTPPYESLAPLSTADTVTVPGSSVKTGAPRQHRGLNKVRPVPGVRLRLDAGRPVR